MRRVTGYSYLVLPPMVLLFLAANVIEYLLCLRASGTPSIRPAILVAKGALIPAAIQPWEWWRLIAAGFLHLDPMHLLANLLSLVVIGPVLERRLGASAFAIIYSAALVGAGLASVLLHSGPFVGVGASGAIFGILGALVTLWAFGATDLSPAFFLATLALNLAIALRDARIDWAAHAGGFVAGMASILLFDIVSRTSPYMLRCKFPEFVKINALLLICLGGAYLWFHPLRLFPSYDRRLVTAAASVIAVLVLIKLLDVLLAIRRGLAAIVLLFGVLNSAVAYVGFGLLRPVIAVQCRSAIVSGAWGKTTIQTLCLNIDRLVYAVAATALLFTLIVYAFPLRRGLFDVGFVGATFVGDRNRERGLVRPTRYTRVS